MDTYTPRLVFSVLCLLGFLAITTGAALEVGRQRRGESMISRRHFRWRMVSAAVWILILLTLGYGVLFEWPASSKDHVALQRMLTIILGSMVLMFIAMGLFFVDLFFTMKTRQLYSQKMDRDINQRAQAELERLQGRQHPGEDKTA